MPRVNEKLAPQQILDKLGIEFTERANRLSILCPFHDDNVPSAAVYIDSEGFYCFTCQLSLSLTQLYVRVASVSIQEAKLEIGEQERYRGPKINKPLITRIKIKSNDRLRILKKDERMITCSEHGKISEVIDKIIWQYYRGDIDEKTLKKHWDKWQSKWGGSYVRKHRS